MNSAATNTEATCLATMGSRIESSAPTLTAGREVRRTVRQDHHAVEPRGLPRCIADDVELGPGVRVYAYSNLYGCRIGEQTTIGAMVEIQRGAAIGARCKVSSHTFICEGVTIEDDVFIGHGVTFINDRYPRATNGDGQPQGPGDWRCIPTVVRRGASVGSGSTLLCGTTIGEDAIVGAGSVVTHDILARTVVAGNPARVMRHL